VSVVFSWDRLGCQEARRLPDDNGNGLQIGGTVSDFAWGYVVSDNIITNAGLDGIKVHQATGFTFQGNVIQNVGIGNGGNHDGGIDFVAVTDSAVMGNAVVRTGGNSCLMLKGGTARNRISGNSFAGCKDAIHVGGLTDDQFMAPGAGGKEAYGNVIAGNKLCASGSGIRLFDGEQRRQDNEITGNSCAGVDVGTIGPTLKPLDAEKIANDIALMRQRRLNDSAIRYSLGLQGIEVPNDVLRGEKTVQEAIADGSMNQSGTPTSWSPPPVPPAPKPGLSPKGSSQAGWQPSTAIPSIDAMRRAVQSNTKPPRCWGWPVGHPLP
jgi:hypothetical protein